MKIQENVSLKSYTNYGIGGKARYFSTAKTEQDIVDSLEWAKQKNLSIFVLGSGTNIVISDTGYHGFVLFVNLEEYSVHETQITACAGVDFQAVVDLATHNELSGLEWAGGLPGSFGGAIHGNVGAFGGELKDILVSVKAINPQGNVVDMSVQECEMHYRNTIFKKQSGWVIVSGVLQLTHGDSNAISKQVEDLREWRRTKHPLEYGNCGSVFKRIPVENIPQRIMDQHPDISSAIRDGQVAIAYFIDQCGLKQYRIGGIEVSDKHPNFLVNVTGDGTADDLIMLIGVVKHAVLEKFGIFLEEEVEFVGF